MNGVFWLLSGCRESIFIIEDYLVREVDIVADLVEESCLEEVSLDVVCESWGKLEASLGDPGPTQLRGIVDEIDPDGFGAAVS